MRVGSLFSGIGGIDLGLQRAGMEIIWQVEIDEWCRRVLARHFPDAVRYGDVRDCQGSCMADTTGEGRQPRRGRGSEPGNAPEDATPCGTLAPVDLICGGFPCQPVSHAGRRLGAEDERWLWPEFMRIIREVRPQWALVENVPGLLSIDDGRLFGGMLRNLAEGGYDAEWNCIPAAALGAPHIRDRVFVVAHANCGGGSAQPGQQQESVAKIADGGGAGNVALTEYPRQGQRWSWKAGRAIPECSAGWWTTQCRLGIASHGLSEGLDCGGWECGVPRIVKGQKDRINRLRGLGNAVVPVVAEHIGRLILDADAETT